MVDIQKLADIAERTADYEDVGEYGYGGEVFSKDVVVNWPQVVQAVIDAYEAERSQ